jgi:hypothetical protein
MNPVRIEYEKDDIYEKPDSDKLNFLIDIAFSNHQQLVNQGLTLYGSGNPTLASTAISYSVSTAGTTLYLPWRVATP